MKEITKRIHMKINLAENLLRFGAKNLSEDVKLKLTEQAYPEFGKGEIPLKPGATYVMQYTHAGYSKGGSGVGPDRICVIPKGTRFVVDKSGMFAVATIKKGIRWKQGSIPAGLSVVDALDPKKAGQLISALDTGDIMVSWSADWSNSLAVKGSVGYSYEFSNTVRDALNRALKA